MLSAVIVSDGCGCVIDVNCQPKSTGEQKTKPTQNTVRELRGFGLSPDLACISTVVTRFALFNN